MGKCAYAVRAGCAAGNVAFSQPQLVGGTFKSLLVAAMGPPALKQGTCPRVRLVQNRYAIVKNKKALCTYGGLKGLAVCNMPPHLPSSRVVYVVPKQAGFLARVHGLAAPSRFTGGGMVAAGSPLQWARPRQVYTDFPLLTCFR